MISVITVTRNAASALALTSESINQQTIRHRIQHVVIDGASDDGSAVEALSRKLSQDVVVSEPDKGIYDAMNKGIFRASGSWVVFMNAGDRFESSDALEKCLGQLTDRVDVLLAETMVEFHDEIEVRFFHKKVVKPSDWWKGMPSCHQSILYRTEVLRQYPFDLRYRWCADFDQFVRIWQGGHSISSVPFVLAHYDGNGADGRNPETYISEREMAVNGLGLGMAGKVFFARERFRCFVIGPCIRWLKTMLPAKQLQRLRRLRGTAGNLSSIYSEPNR